MKLYPFNVSLCHSKHFTVSSNLRELNMLYRYNNARALMKYIIGNRNNGGFAFLSAYFHTSPLEMISIHSDAQYVRYMIKLITSLLLKIVYYSYQNGHFVFVMLWIYYRIHASITEKFVRGMRKRNCDGFYRCIIFFLKGIITSVINFYKDVICFNMLKMSRYSRKIPYFCRKKKVNMS